MTEYTTTLMSDRLLRVRFGVRAVLTVGVAASVAANVLAAEASLVGRLVAAWPPLALLLTVELLARVPAASRALSAVRVVTTATVAGIAAWVSYWHMVTVALAHGETSTSAHLLPVSVDGLVVVASVCLVEIAHHHRGTPHPNTTAPPDVVTPHVSGMASDQALATAWAVAVEVADQGRALTRTALATGLRARGVPISTARAGHLLHTLRATSPGGPTTTGPAISKGGDTPTRSSPPNPGPAGSGPVLTR